MLELPILFALLIVYFGWKLLSGSSPKHQSTRHGGKTRKDRRQDDYNATTQEKDGARKAQREDGTIDLDDVPKHLLMRAGKELGVDMSTYGDRRKLTRGIKKKLAAGKRSKTLWKLANPHRQIREDEVESRDPESEVDDESTLKRSRGEKATTRETDEGSRQRTIDLGKLRRTRLVDVGQAIGLKSMAFMDKNEIAEAVSTILTPEQVNNVLTNTNWLPEEVDHDYTYTRSDASGATEERSIVDQLRGLGRARLVEIGKALELKRMDLMSQDKIADSIADCLSVREVERLIQDADFLPSRRTSSETSSEEEISSLGDLGLEQDDVMESIRQKLARKRESLDKWRRRYSNSDYPERLATNLIGAEMTASALASKASNHFNGRSDTQDLRTALSQVGAIRSKMSRKIARRVSERLSGKRNSLGRYAGGVDYNGLMKAASEGASGGNQAVEKIEYNWTHSALKGDLLELWLAAGAVGMSRKTAFSELFYFAEIDSGLDRSHQVEGVFSQLSGVILSAPNTYRSKPPLWT